MAQGIVIKKPEQQYQAPVKMDKMKKQLPRIEFKYEEDDTEGKEVYTVYGEKGTGKTALALGFPGKKFVISMDKKTQRIKRLMYNNSPDIVIVDGTKYLTHEKDKYLASCVYSYEWLHFNLDVKLAQPEELRPDWVIFDGTEVIIEITEMVMRFDNDLEPFQGIANLGVWKDRKLNIRALHDKAIKLARRGVIYTTYTDKDEIVKDGMLIRVDKVPKWVDVVMTETDAVLYVTAEYDKEKRKMEHFCTVMTSKVDKFKTGDCINFTGKTISEILNWK